LANDSRLRRNPRNIYGAQVLTEVIALHQARARLGIQSDHLQFHPTTLKPLQDAGLSDHGFSTSSVMA
jgi:hypothetical protein